MFKTILVFIFSACVPVTAYAAQKQDIRGFRTGMTKIEAEARTKAICETRIIPPSMDPGDIQQLLGTKKPQAMVDPNCYLDNGGVALIYTKNMDVQKVVSVRNWFRSSLNFSEMIDLVVNEFGGRARYTKGPDNKTDVLDYIDLGNDHVIKLTIEMPYFERVGNQTLVTYQVVLTDQRLSRTDLEVGGIKETEKRRSGPTPKF